MRNVIEIKGKKQDCRYYPGFLKSFKLLSGLLVSLLRPIYILGTIPEYFLSFQQAVLFTKKPVYTSTEN
jgi:hypothetical protein